MNIVCRELDNVEFFTIEATGESGMSQSGLAVLCGVSRSTISKLEKSLLTETCPETLKSFLEASYTLLNQGSYTVNGVVMPNLKIYKSGFCASVIQHYATKGNKTAIFSLTKFAAMGIENWIQGITGWQTSIQAQSPQPTTPLALPPDSMSADLSPDSELYQLFKEAGQREIVRKFFS